MIMKEDLIDLRKAFFFQIINKATKKSINLNS